MFCSQCGKELPENSKFCTECGRKLLVSSEIITGTKAKPHMVSKNGDNMGQIIEPSVEMPNLDSKNAEPQMQTQVSKFKIIIWATVIFLVILLVASSIFDLILYGLGLDTEFAGALAAVTAGIFAGWYYLAEKEKKIKAQTNYAQSNKITFSGSKAREKFFLGLEIIIVIAFFVICALFAFNNFKADNTSNKGQTCDQGYYLIEPYMHFIWGDTTVCVSLEQLNNACKVKKGASSYYTGERDSDGTYICY